MPKGPPRVVVSGRVREDLRDWFVTFSASRDQTVSETLEQLIERLQRGTAKDDA